jgi:2-polyprenyl-3-methyl-5-hydroxy-6-metoxy-1,4-benzoquinol methylase
MSVVDENKQFYNRLYRRRNRWLSLLHSRVSFDQQSKSRINYSIVRNFLRDRLGNQTMVLDYGFGHGSLLLKYPRHFQLYGSDISEETVLNFPQVAAIAGRKVNTALVDDFQARYRDVRFDVITLSHVIEHVDDDAGLVCKLVTMLAENGVVLINVPINEVWTDPKHVRAYSREYLLQLLERCGLRALSITETDKLTSFFLDQEMVKKPGKIRVKLIKMIRLFFGIAPAIFSRIFEKFFLASHKPQQLIVLAVRR